MAHGRLIKALDGLQAELHEKKAAEERAAQAETNEPKCLKDNTYEPIEEIF